MKTKISLVILIAFTLSGCMAATISKRSDNFIKGSAQWENYLMTECPKINFQLSQCVAAARLRTQRETLKRVHEENNPSPELLAQRQKEWANVQQWFGFMGSVNQLNNSIPDTAYSQKKQVNRQQDRQRGHCLAQCSNGSGSSMRQCQVYCNSVFPEVY